MRERNEISGSEELLPIDEPNDQLARSSRVGNDGTQNGGNGHIKTRL